MSIIKIHLYREHTDKEQKYLLTYIPEVHNTVEHFLQFASKTLDIHCSVEEMIIQHDGYMLPHCLDGKILANTQLLTIKIKKVKKMSPPLGFWTAKKVPEVEQQQKNLILNNQLINHLDEQVSLSSQSTPKFSQDGLARQTIHKKSQKSLKQKNKLRQKPKQTLSTTKKRVAQKLPSSSEQEQQEIGRKVKPQKVKKNKNKKKKVIQPSSEEQPEQQPEQSQSSVEQSSQEELPRVSKSKKNQIKQKIQTKKAQVQEQRNIHKFVRQSKGNDQNKTQKAAFTRQQSFGHKEKDMTQEQPRQNKVMKPIKNIPQPAVSTTVTYAQRKKVIQADDIQSSDSSQQQQVNVNPSFSSLNKSSGQQPKMLPPSLRNKIQPASSNSSKFSNKNSASNPSSQQKSPAVQSSFKKHLQQQWIVITKQILERIQKQNPLLLQQEKTILKPNNLIKFREIQLDQQKFVPKTSEWIEAAVDRVQNDGKLILKRVSQLGKDYRERYDIYQFNMVQLQVNRNHLTKEQLILIEGQTTPGNQASKDHNQKMTTLMVTQESGAKPQNKAQPEDKNSIEKFICGQVNFYFSDKNYPFDLFMQMHANKHPQKYIPIRFLLNFPKIKKILKDQNKLLQYLVEDQKKQTRNFQINAQTKMVRKKEVIATVHVSEISQNTNKIIEEQKYEDSAEQ